MSKSNLEAETEFLKNLEEQHIKAARHARYMENWCKGDAKHTDNYSDVERYRTEAECHEVAAGKIKIGFWKRVTQSK